MTSIAPTAGLRRTHSGILPRDSLGSLGGSVCGALVIGLAPIFLLSMAMARYGLFHRGVLALAGLTLWLNAWIVLKDLRYGLAMFIVAAGVSPKLPGFYNNLRLEDFIFTLVFGIWVLQTMRHRRIPAVRSPIVFPFLLLTLMGVLSTAWGFSLGTIPDWKYSFFLQAKRIEYFLIFWVVATTVRSEPWLRLLTLLFVASGALAALYGLAFAQEETDYAIARKRVTGPEGENYNTLSGYLVLCIAAGLAAIPGFRERRSRGILIGCAAVAALGLLFSFSREGYVMLAGSLLVFGFTRHRSILLGAGLALAVALLVAEPVRQNVHNTIQTIQVSRHDDPGGNSLTARFSAWEWRWSGWFVKHPIIGNGVGSVALSVDNEYLMRACEVGLIGLSFFAWWLAAVGRQVKRLQASEGFRSFLALGLASGFVGLLIQGIVAASFTTIRTMEPFWFLLGLVSATALTRRPEVRRSFQRIRTFSGPGVGGSAARATEGPHPASRAE